MAGIYKNITTDANGTVTTLMALGASSGGINSIKICNADTLPAENVELYYEDASANKFYIIKGIDIPVGATLILDEGLSFDSRVYHLKILTNKDSGSGPPSISVIIK